jgi:transcriptional regulator with XRE-family HTH domain
MKLADQIEKRRANMKFGEKVKMLRKDMKLSQGELAEKIGVSMRSVQAYEAGTSYPRYKKIYEALAAALGVDVNYLRTEDEEFMEEVGQKYGTRGQRQATAILEEARRLFAGGELSDEDQMAFLTEMQQLFLDSKQRAKKFTPKRYLHDDGDQ